MSDFETASRRTTTMWVHVEFYTTISLSHAPIALAKYLMHLLDCFNLRDHPKTDWPSVSLVPCAKTSCSKL
eukprot:scaffold26550_cov122-Cylindrotheca_fusiformis.AAC.7